MKESPEWYHVGVLVEIIAEDINDSCPKQGGFARVSQCRKKYNSKCHKLTPYPQL